ncbi:MAG: hypothetical protein OXP69_01360 [Spirochaetaceae bacterium]|nr:hypothetical protein [Spirochaetaceae bacterium]
MRAERHNPLRMAAGLLVAAALVTVPLWWEAASRLVRSGPLAPTWPWLVPALLGAVVVALTLAPLRAPRRRRASTATPPAPSSPAPRQPEAIEERRPEPEAERRRASVEVWETAAFAEAVQRFRDSVALEGGVYRVREQVYGAPAEPRRSLRLTAETVITDDKIARLASAGQRRQVRTRVTGAGVDYDQLLAQFRGTGAGDTRRRVLEEQRAALAAHAAVLLVEQAAGYTAGVAAGSPHLVLSAMAVSAGDRLYDEHLRARRYVLAGPGSDVCTRLPFAAERMALLPATLDGRHAYLLFAASMPDDATVQASAQWSRETLMDRLNLHT